MNIIEQKSINDYYSRLYLAENTTERDTHHYPLSLHPAWFSLRYAGQLKSSLINLNFSTAVLILWAATLLLIKYNLK